MPRMPVGLLLRFRCHNILPLCSWHVFGVLYELLPNLLPRPLRIGNWKLHVHGMCPRKNEFRRGNGVLQLFLGPFAAAHGKFHEFHSVARRRNGNSLGIQPTAAGRSSYLNVSAWRRFSMGPVVARAGMMELLWPLVPLVIK